MTAQNSTVDTDVINVRQFNRFRTKLINNPTTYIQTPVSYFKEQTVNI